MEAKQIAIAKLRRDGGTQHRAELRPDIIEEYADAMEAGAKFPPVVAFYDGKDYWLAEGYHRAAAAESISRVKIDVDVRQGTQRDAQWHSFGANATHGMRRNRTDVNRILQAIFADDEWAGASLSKIVKHTGIPMSTVHDHRQRHLSETGKIDSGEREVTRGGTTYSQNTANIGKNRKPKLPEVEAGIVTGPLRIVTKEEYEASGELGHVPIPEESTESEESSKRVVVNKPRPSATFEFYLDDAPRIAQTLMAHCEKQVLAMVVTIINRSLKE